MGHVFNRDKVDLIKQNFEYCCISLLIDAYNSAMQSKIFSLDWKENKFSAHLAGFIKNSSRSKDWKIKLVREYYLDNEATFEGLVDPDESARIDFEFSNWTFEDEITYYIEAKNLAENDLHKEQGSNVDASKLRRRYIDTGINNFINKKYPRGCLAGYVIDGNNENIINKINQLINKDKRMSEIINKSDPINEHEGCFCSTHNQLELLHIFLNFTN